MVEGVRWTNEGHCQRVDGFGREEAGREGRGCSGSSGYGVGWA